MSAHEELKIDGCKLMCMDVSCSLVCVILSTCLNDAFDGALSVGSGILIMNHHWFFMDTGTIDKAPQHDRGQSAMEFSMPTS